MHRTRPRAGRRWLLLPLLLLAALLGCASATEPLPGQGGVRVLFIGNSLTYVNDLPRTLAALARSVNDTPLVYRVVAKPDYALEDHWYENVAAKIAANDWEYVVMQQGPSATNDGKIHLAAWTQQLNTAIQPAGARAALYQVWPADHDTVRFRGVRESYSEAAQLVGGMFIPAGQAWLAAWERDPTLQLYASDNFHPSAMGTYLSALVHFEMLYNRPATDLPDDAIVDGRSLGLPVARVQLLQEAAHETVLAWGVR